ncbi:MAG UNVERIFIED_CONTAM: hypothetical protein LVT10_04785 [Anaerolineae bacterium]
MTEAEFETTLHALNQKLYAYRSQRVAPALDDKMLSQLEWDDAGESGGSCAGIKAH